MQGTDFAKFLKDWLGRILGVDPEVNGFVNKLRGWNTDWSKRTSLLLKKVNIAFGNHQHMSHITLKQ